MYFSVGDTGNVQEREWLQRIAAGDEAALTLLYTAYQPRLARFLLRFTSSAAMIEEVINDVLFVVWRNSAGFRGDSSPSTWIFGIAYKKMLKALSRAQTRTPEPEIPATGPDPSQEVAAAIRQLPPAQSAVVVLTYEFGYSYREISEILGCPENTVKSRMFNARKTLKTLLEA